MSCSVQVFLASNNDRSRNCTTSQQAMDKSTWRERLPAPCPLKVQGWPGPDSGQIFVMWGVVACLPILV